MTSDNLVTPFITLHSTNAIVKSSQNPLCTLYPYTAFFSAVPVWSDWSEWSNCSEILNQELGFRNRSRSCIFPEPSSSSAFSCSGLTVENGTCEIGKNE